MNSSKNKYYAYMLKKIGNSFDLVDIIELKITDTSFDFKKGTKKGTYVVNLENYFFRNKNKLYYFFEIGNSTQIHSTYTENQKLKPTELKRFVTSHVVADMINQSTGKKDWFVIIFSVLMGLGLGFGLGTMLGQFLLNAIVGG